MKEVRVKRILGRLTALFLMFSLGMNLVYIPVGYSLNLTEVFINDTFNNMWVGTEPENYDYSGDGGSVTIESYADELCVYVKNDVDGKYIMLSKSFATVTEEVLEISLDFLQPFALGDSVLLSLYEGSHEFAKIVTENGAICFVTDEETVPVLDEYQTEQWYTLGAEVNLSSGTAQILVNGEVKLSDAEFTNSSASCNKIGFYTNHSPGFYLDNFYVNKKTNMNKITIEGPEIVTIPEYGFNEYEFSAYITDKNGNVVNNTPIIWEIANNSEGQFSGAELVQMDTYGQKMILSVTADATYRGIIKLKAVYDGENADENAPEVYYSVAVEKQKVDTIEISGPARITTGLDRADRQYCVVAKDPYGKEINQVESTWYLKEDSPSYVYIDKGGVLTLTKSVTEDTPVTICAQVKDPDIVAERTVILQNQKNYQSDIWRLKVLQNAVDNVIKYGKDPYSGSPLLASGIDLRTMLPVEWKQSLNTKSAAFSNLAFDTGLYMVFDVLSELVDDPKYTEKVDEIYNWYLENGLADNMLGYWGGHTFIDLKTMRPYNAEPNPNTHEFKDTYFYFDPFYRLDSEKAYKMGMHVWLGHVYDWNTLITNRHAYYTKVHDENNWENLSAFPEKYELIITRSEQPFRSMACDLVYTAGQMYKQTGDEKAKIWAMRILKCYYELADPNTNIIPGVYTTARGAEGTLDPMEYVEPIGSWYTNPDLSTEDHTVLYGDRFFNQFAEDLVAQGFYDASVLEEGDYTLTEGHFNQTTKSSYALNDLFFADLIGADTEEGKYVVEKIVKHMAGFIECAWEKNSNKFKYVMSDGTDISEFIPNRNGYYGNYYNLGKPMGTYTPDSLFMWAVCAAYRAASEREDLQNEAEIIYTLIDYFAEQVYGWGKLGDAEIGDSRMKLNYNTGDASAYNVLCLVDLYWATGKKEFLDLARVVAGNFINSNFQYGVFIPKTTIGTTPGSCYNLALGSQSIVYYYALAYLEGAIRNDRDLVPRSLIFAGYYQDNFVSENNDIHRVMDTVWWYFADPKVLVQDIVLESESIFLAPGESKTLNYSVLPLDATNKSISFWFTDNTVAKIDSSTGEITGLSSGETELICVSSDLNVNKTIKVVVE